MFKLLIVDDEKITRDSLVEFIDWVSLGIDLVEVAENGVQALEKIRANPPDIVLTDVKMPHMNGIDLAYRLKQIQPECLVVFISGFSDKQYLLDAIQLGAVRYLEKPLRTNEVEHIIRQCVATLTNQESQKHYIQSLHDNAAKSSLLMLEQLTCQVLSGQAPLDQIIGRNQTYATMIVLEVDWVSGDERSMIIQRILDTVRSDSAFANIPACHYQDFELCLLIPGTEKRSLLGSNLLAAAQLLLPPDSVFAVASSTFYTNSPLQTVIDQLHAMAQQRFIFGSGKLFDIYIEGEAFRPDLQLQDKLLNLITTRQIDLAKNKIDEYFYTINQQPVADISSVRRFWENLALAILDTVSQLADSVDQSAKSSYIRKINGCNTLPGIIKLIKTILSEMEKESEGNIKIREAEIYILDHFADLNLNAAVIADAVGLSPNYLSAQFKRIKGISMNEFITNARISNARRLLKTSDDKMPVIAMQSGFTDANYFATKFSRQVGCSPSEYRQKIRATQLERMQRESHDPV